MGKIYVLNPNGGGGRRVDLSFITATSDKILTGYIGCDQDGNQVEGTMPNNGYISGSVYAGESYTIPAGYTRGGGIEAAPLSVQTPGTASAGDIWINKTAWVDGKKITGSMNQQYTREHLLNLEDYNSTGSASGTTEFIENSGAETIMMNINCEQLGGTGFFQISKSTNTQTITRQFVIPNEIRADVTLTVYPSGKQFAVTIKATNIGAEYLYYDFYVDYILTF